MTSTPRLETKFRRLAVACFAATGGLNVLVLLAWRLGLPPVGVLNVAGSVVLLLLGLAVAAWLGQRQANSAATKWFGFGIGLGVLVTTSLICAKKIHSGPEWPVENWLVLVAAGSISATHMSKPAAFGCLLLSLAWFCQVRPWFRHWAARQVAAILALTALIFGATNLLCHLLQAKFSAPMSIPTGADLFLLGLGLMLTAGLDVWPSRLFFPPPEKTPSARRFVWGLLSLVLLLGVTVAATNWYYFKSQQIHAAHAAQTVLANLADLKAAQIADWRRERLADARFIVNNPFAVRRALELLSQPMSPQSEQLLRDWVKPLIFNKIYDHVFVLDESLNLRLAQPKLNTSRPSEPELNTAKEAISSQKIVEVDLHQVKRRNAIFLSYALPLNASFEATGVVGPLTGTNVLASRQVRCAMILRIDARKSLMPMAQTWVTPSATTEVELVRREGGEVVLLNELRHRTNVALTLRLPLAKRSVEARAVLGLGKSNGVIQGGDYRDMPVLAVWRKIAGTPWFLIAKVDEEEIYAPLQRQAWTIAGFVGLLIAVAMLGIAMLGRQRYLNSIRRELFLERQHREDESKFSTLFESSRDAILLLDRTAYVDCNRAALDLLGFATKEQFMAKCLGELSPPRQADGTDSRTAARDHLEASFARGGQLSEWLFQRQDGTVFPAEVQSSRVELGGRVLIQLMVRDITARKQMETGLRKANRALLLISQFDQEMVRATDETALLQTACRLAVECGGYRKAWIGFAETDEAKTVRPVAHTGFASGYFDALKLTWADVESGRGPTGTAIRTGQPVVTRNISTDPAYGSWRESAIQGGYASSVALPLHGEGRCFGAFSLHSPEPDLFGADEVKLLVELADDLAYGIVALRHRIERKRAEAEAERTAREWQTTFDATNDAIWILDNDSRVLRSNQMAERIFRHPCGEMTGKRCFEIVHGTTEPIPACPLVRARRSGRRETLELQNGGQWFEILVDPILDAAGQYAGAVHIVSDITERKRAEESLRQLTQVSAASSDYIVLIGPDFRYRFVNDVYLKARHLRPEDMVGRHMQEIVGREKFEQLGRPQVEACLRGEAVETCEWSDFGSGTAHFLHVTVTPFREPDGTISGAVISGRDITELKQAEEGLRESETRFHELFSHMSSGVAVYEARNDGRDFVFKDFNRAAEWIEATPRDAVLGRSVVEVFPGVREFGLLNVLQRVWRTGQPEHHPAEIYRDNHIVGWRENHVYKLPSGEIVAVFDDLTERKRAEAALADEAVRRRILIEESRDGIVVLDQDGKVFEANRRYAEMLGYSSDEVRQLHVWDWDTQWTRDHLMEMIRLDDTDGNHFETRHRRKDGTVYDVEISSNGAICGGRKLIFCVCRDITERKQMEQSLRKLSLHLSRAEDAERRRIARELHDSTGQKLAALSMTVGLLQDSTAAPDGKTDKMFADCLALIEQCVQEIRTISYLLHPPLLDELGLAAAIGDYLEGFSKRSGVQVALDAPPDLNRLPDEIELALFRVVQESLGNIHHHAGASSARIHLACDAEQVTLEVSDQGRGISDETLRAIQAGHGPTGVGIAGMRERLRLLGGRLEITSSKGGTTLRATIPQPEKTT